MEPKLSNASSIYGASMGRRETRTDPDAALTFRVYRMRLDEGGYDNGGAYWGSGQPLYRAFAGSDEFGIAAEMFVRAPDRMAAMRAVLARYPRARFFRGAVDSLDFAEFLQGYMIAALWASTAGEEDGCEYLDEKFGIHDIAPATRQAMHADCTKFFRAYSDLWVGMWTHEEAGHDFWMTRAGTGVSFADRRHGEAGERLAEAARAFGEVYLYAGDDGRIYQ